MRSLLSAQQVLELDKRCESEYSLSPGILMENAGRSCYELFRNEYLQEGGRVVILAGSGNNGGDAYVFARALFIFAQCRPWLISVSEPRTPLCIEQHFICRKLNIPIMTWEERASVLPLLRSAQWIVDGICGVGLREGLRETVIPLIKEVNNAEASVFSLDVPSGIFDSFQKEDCAIQADCTATIAFYKAMLYTPAARPYCGRIVAVNAGFPPALLDSISVKCSLAEDSDIAIPFSANSHAVHKNKKGVLAICAGARGMGGAAVLAARAAMAMDIGKVHLLMDAELGYLASTIPAALVRAATTEDLEGLSCNAFLAGCGWGTENREEQLECVLKRSEPVVLDADALTLLAESAELQSILQRSQRAARVLTPHPGEAAALLATTSSEILRNAESAATAIAQQYRAIVVLKSHVPLITNGEKLVIVDGMNNALATAGSGDVLAGIIAALCAQGMDAESAALTGVQLHQAAGRELIEQDTFGSEMLADIVGRTYKHYRAMIE